METQVHGYDEDSSELKNVALGLIAIANEIRLLTFGSASNISIGAIEGLTVRICENLAHLNDSLTQLIEKSHQ